MVPPVYSRDMKVPPEQGFRFSDGLVVYSLRELAHALNDTRFAAHVGEGRNDFASWIHDCFKNTVLADRIRTARNAWDVITILRDAGHDTTPDFPVDDVHLETLFPGFVQQERQQQGKSQSTQPPQSTQSVQSNESPPTSFVQTPAQPQAGETSSVEPIVPSSGPTELSSELKGLLSTALNADTADMHNSEELVERNMRREVIFWGIWDFVLGIVVGFAIGYFVMRVLF
jgi:hypothetical protein